MTGVLRSERGRPSKLTPERRLQIVSLVRAGANRTDAARAVGVSRSTLHRWLQQGQRAKSGEARSFHDDVMQAEAQAVVEAEIRVKRTNPLAWLRFGTAAARPGVRSWQAGHFFISEAQLLDEARSMARSVGLPAEEAEEILQIAASLEGSYARLEFDDLAE